MRSDFYTDTATDVAVGELLLDIASGRNVSASQRDRLIALAHEFGSVSDPRPAPRFPIMVVSDDYGAVAYSPSEEFADQIAELLSTATLRVTP